MVCDAATETLRGVEAEPRWGRAWQEDGCQIGGGSRWRTTIYNVFGAWAAENVPFLLCYRCVKSVCSFRGCGFFLILRKEGGAKGVIITRECPITSMNGINQKICLSSLTRWDFPRMILGNVSFFRFLHERDYRCKKQRIVLSRPTFIRQVSASTSFIRDSRLRCW